MSFLLYVMSVIDVLGVVFFFFFQAEDGIRDLVRSRGLGDVYKRQASVEFGSKFLQTIRRPHRHFFKECQIVRQNPLVLSLIHI